MSKDEAAQGHKHGHDHDDADTLPAAAAGEGEAADGGGAPEEEAIDSGQRSLNRALNLSFVMLKAMMLLVIVLFFLDCAQELQQNQIGLVKRFGRYLANADGTLRRLEPGRYHLIWPSPMEELERVSLSKRDLTLDQEFWTADAARRLDSGGLPADRQSFAPATDGYNLSGDLNILHTRWRVEYQVDPDHPEDFLQATAKGIEDGPQRILRSVAAGVIMRNIAGLSTDDVLVNRQVELKRVVLREIQQEMRDPATGRYRAGLMVSNVLLAAINPPTRVKADFDLVTQAMSDRQTKIDDAGREARRILETSRSDANKVLEDATVVRKETVEYARADAARVRSLLDQFKDDPAGLGVALEQVRLDVVDRMMRSARVITLPAAKPAGGHHVVMIAPQQALPAVVENAQ